VSSVLNLIKIGALRLWGNLQRSSDWLSRELLRALVSDGKMTVSAAAALTFVLAIPVMLFPFYSPNGGVLRGDWTDHFHHNYAAWSFLRRGIAIYKLPLSAWKSHYPFEGKMHWQEHPFEYPPGCILLFLPTAIAGRFARLRYDMFGAGLVVYLLAISQVAFFSVLMLLRECQSGARTMVAIYCWVLLTHIALTGFYDATWIGFAAMMLLRLKQGKPTSTVYWFAAASFISFRAAALIPFLLLALWQIYQERPKKYWLPLGILGTVGIVDIWAFYGILKATAPLRDTKDYLNITFVQLAPDSPRFILAMIAMSIGIVIALVARSWMTAVTLVLVTYLVHLNGGHFWRMSLLLAYPLSAAAFTKGPLSSVVRSSAVAIAVLLGAAFSMVSSGDVATIVTDLQASFPPGSVLCSLIFGTLCVTMGMLVLHAGKLARAQVGFEGSALPDSFSSESGS